MKAKKILERAGITIIRQFTVLEVNKIASIISEKICNTFKEHGLSKSDLFIALSRINMYFAEFNDCSAAKYDYKNNSIYFKNNIPYNQIETPAIHECLHFIQTVKNSHGKLQRLGLYEINKIKNNGMALNEASVQLMASNVTNNKNTYDSVKYYGLEFTTESPNYYPIECSLVKQMAYFTGTYPLYHSTIYSDDIFKNTFIMKSSKRTYFKICKNLNLLVDIQESIHNENLYLSQLENEDLIKQSQAKLQEFKKNIRNITLETQELILTSCSYSDLNLVRDKQSVKNFKNKLYKFQKYLIVSEGYNFYNNFYVKMMEELDKKRELIEKYGTLEIFKDIPENLSLLEIRQKRLNLFQLTKQKLIELLKLNKQGEKQKN